MRIDLHTHSTASDGSLTPLELVQQAVSLQIEVLALTDHDTVEGLDEFGFEGKRSGIVTLSGIELSVDYGGGSLHLLGYGFHHDDILLKSVLIDLKKSRHTRNKMIINRLQEIGYDITFERVLQFARNGVMGRPHIAAELVKSGQVESISEAFSKLLRRGSSAYFERRRLSLIEACDLIHQAGGATIWAHPGLHGKNLNSLIGRLPEWKKSGLDGIETDYSAHSISQRDELRRIASNHHMVVTGGSDFHGIYRPGVEMGQGPQGEQVGDECYFQLSERIHEIRTSKVT